MQSKQTNSLGMMRLFFNCTSEYVAALNCTDAVFFGKSSWLSSRDQTNINPPFQRFCRGHTRLSTCLKGFSSGISQLCQFKSTLSPNYLTIIPWARMGYESIALEAEGGMGYWLRGDEGERNNCFDKI